ncbi:MAG: hypothetical protein LKG11_05300 [Bacilli bacterium]|jgi:hypothetical protein|nr:hypothetical protein [Bacilli bacterium]
MRDMTITMAYDSVDKTFAGLLAAFLRENGFKVKTDGVFREKGILALVMTGESRLESIEKANPWVKKEFGRSSTVGLRVLPLVIFDSTKEKIEDVWANAKKIYAIMSEEFKPYAFDMADKEKSLIEFRRVIRDQYEE